MSSSPTPATCQLPLSALLESAIELYIEYTADYDYDSDDAKAQAISEVFEGMSVRCTDMGQPPCQEHQRRNRTMATTEKCIYCNRKVTDLDVPEVDDDEEWDRLALEHRKSCEWIATRAHRVNVDSMDKHTVTCSGSGTKPTYGILWDRVAREWKGKCPRCSQVLPIPESGLLLSHDLNAVQPS